MKLNPLAIVALATLPLAGCAKPQPSSPTWVSEKASLLKQLGIDPNRDLVEAANYHWTWTSRREVLAGSFRCPIGSSVDVSRSIVVVRPPSPQVCHGPGGEAVRMLKVLPDGSAEPLGDVPEVVAGAPEMLGGTDCPNLKSDDPTVAARVAFTRGDCHLLMIGGFAGTVPGSEGSHRSFRMIAGTGDDGDMTGLRDQCDVPRPDAIRWAEQYNRTMVGLAGSHEVCGRNDPSKSGSP